jgi:hypothetical protein
MKDKIHYKTDRELLRTITNNLKETLHEKMEAVKVPPLQQYYFN